MSNFTNTNFLGVPMPKQRPTHSTSFEAKIRNEWVYVDGNAWADEEGIYKTSIAAVWMDVVNVIGILTEDDLSILEEMIPDAIANDYQDNKE